MGIGVEPQEEHRLLGHGPTSYLMSVLGQVIPLQAPVNYNCGSNCGALTDSQILKGTV